MVKCEICGAYFKKVQPLSKHLGTKHPNVNKQNYYDTYFKKDGEGKCHLDDCPHNTNFIDLTAGYEEFCCTDHKVMAHIGKLPRMSEKYNLHTEAMNQPDVQKRVRETIVRLNEEFEKENNCTQVKKLVLQYGQGWRCLNIPTIERNHNAHFISNEYIPLIEEYQSSYHASNKEQQIYEAIESIYKDKIKHNSKRIIPPNELDIYIPKLKIAIEFNGLYWHSLEYGKKPIDYHLNKSLACRNKGIRLVHIYEFEDLDEQIDLVKNLILGNDLYHKDDFNKNSLLNTIPTSEIIYQKQYGTHFFTIYGAGKLYGGDAK